MRLLAEVNDVLGRLVRRVQRRPYRPRGHRIHADALFRQVVCEGFGEGMDGPLGGRIVQQLLAAPQAGDGAGIDDRVAARQVRQRGRGHVEVAVDVRAEGFVQPFLGDVRQRFGVFLERGVVHQDVQLAELGHGLLHRVAAKSRVFHVTPNDQALTALRLHQAGGLLRVLVGAQVNDGDVGTLAGKQQRDRAANAGVAPRDQGRHALQFAAALVVGRVETGLELHGMFVPGLLQMLLRHGRNGLLAARAGCRLLRLLGVA